VPRILAVGIATLDIVNRVAAYPEEDAEIRALSQHRRRGGNATNTLVALSQLGHSAAWAGVLPVEADSALVLEDLLQHHVDVSAVVRPPLGKLPTSYITLSAATGSRTIVHHRNLSEYDFADFDRLELNGFDWIHFEGRNVSQLKMMLEKTRNLGIPCSLEVEKPRKGIETLLALPNVLMLSRVWVEGRGFDSPRSFFRARQEAEQVFLPWGKEGAWCRCADGDVLHAPAPEVDVVDSIGAGDVFNAAVIDAILMGLSAGNVLEHAVRLASAKCAREGLVI
jgi:ketohexokinase